MFYIKLLVIRCKETLFFAAAERSTVMYKLFVEFLPVLAVGIGYSVLRAWVKGVCRSWLRSAAQV